MRVGEIHTRVRPILYCALIDANRQFSRLLERGASSQDPSDGALEYALLVIRRRLAVQLVED